MSVSLVPQVLGSVDSLTDEMSALWISQNISKKIPEEAKAKLMGRHLSLDLSRLPLIVDANISQLAGLHVLKLNLSGQQYLTDNAMKTVGTLTDLQALSLANLSTVTEKGLREVAKATNLTELDLKSCNQIRDLEALSQLRKLEVLDISQCPKINDQTISNLMALPLRSIKMQSCFGLSSKVFTDLEEVSTLKVLDISGNIRFNKERVQEFIRRNPHVQLIK